MLDMIRGLVIHLDTEEDLPASYPTLLVEGGSSLPDCIVFERIYSCRTPIKKYL